jgi:HprK-related kinase A
LRRWFKPQVRFIADGTMPLEPFPANHALPLLEWGANWLIARRMNNVLLLHAGVLERNGLALVLPALSGSGKSTLTAALSLRGWRLLSDEFGAFDPAAGGFRAVLKPVALKNKSIEVIRHFEPTAELGPVFPNTRKGAVAHLAPSTASAANVHAVTLPGAIVMPRWRAGSPTRLEPSQSKVAFSSLAFNAFNYATMGPVGFNAVVSLVQQCTAWHLVYSDLDDAIATLQRAWSAVVEHRCAYATRARPSETPVRQALIS